MGAKGTIGPFDYFVGNANGRGLIRIEAAHNSPDAGEIIATMVRGKRSEINASLLAASWEMRALLSRGSAILKGETVRGTWVEQVDALLARIDGAA